VRRGRGGEISLPWVFLKVGAYTELNMLPPEPTGSGTAALWSARLDVDGV